MHVNKTRAKLEAGQTVFGINMRFPSPEMVEMLGAMGFDYALFNLEHEPYDERDMLHSIRAAEAFGVTPMIRLPNDADVMRRFLEAGVQGIHVARINTAQEAQRVVDAVRFKPQGNRTFSAGGRSSDYGVGTSEREALAFANRENMITLQVEEAEGIRNLDEILAVPYVDAVQIGPKDLWQSLGFADYAKVWQVVEDALRRCAEAGRWTAMVFWIGDDPNQDKMERYGKLGVRMMSAQQKELLGYGAHAFFERARASARAGTHPS
jgi:4-hydroxy-2-oxoheptanedioate aldolase